MRLSSPLLLAVLLSSTAAHADFIDHFANPDDVGTLKVPRSGEVAVLVLPVVIDDLPFEQGGEQAFLDDVAAFFSSVEPGSAEPLTFRSFYEAQSLGRYAPAPVVAAPIHFPTCPPLGEHEGCAIPRGGGVSEGDLAGAVAVFADSMRFLDEILRCATVGPNAEARCTSGGGVDLGAVDTSGPVAGTPDGVVDGVIVVTNGGFPGIALPIKHLSQNQLLSFAGPFPSFEYEGKTVGAVAIAGRESLPQRQNLVAIHEFGHLLGFCDLYNESGASTDLPHTYMGGWYYDAAPSLLDPFSRVAIGWAHLVQVSGSGSYRLPFVDEHGTVLKIGTGLEFFLVEARRKRAGRSDDDLAVERGVFVERVRLQRRPAATEGSFLVNTLPNCVNCDPDDPMLAMEQADGRFDLERGFARSDEDDLFLAGDELAPSDDEGARTASHRVLSSNLYDGQQTGITVRVTDIDAAGATVEIEAADVPDACRTIEDLCGPLACTAGTDDGVSDADDGACGAPPPPQGRDPPAEDAGCGCAAEGASSTSSLLPWGVGLASALAVRRRRSSHGRGCRRSCRDGGAPHS